MSMLVFIIDCLGFVHLTLDGMCELLSLVEPVMDGMLEDGASWSNGDIHPRTLVRALSLS